MIYFYAFEIELAQVLVKASQFCLYISWYPVYINVVKFYTFEGDSYKCGWILYIWGKFYTIVEFYKF